MSRTFSTSRIQREVIHAKGHIGSNQKSAVSLFMCGTTNSEVQTFPGSQSVSSPTATPSSAQTASTRSIGHFSQNTSAKAIGAITAERHSPSVCTPKKTARFAITPTTAAVTPVSAAARVRFSRNRSTYGAPRKMNRNDGTKVTQVTRSDAITAAAIGSREPGSRYAPRNATNCSTMISGPGVDSASASPCTISPAVSQPYDSTAFCATNASTAYAPPKVTSAVPEKKTPICTNTESRSVSRYATRTGSSQTTMPPTSTARLRRTEGVAR